MSCGECRAANPAAALFCYSCGAPLLDPSSIVAAKLERVARRSLDAEERAKKLRHERSRVIFANVFKDVFRLDVAILFLVMLCTCMGGLIRNSAQEAQHLSIDGPRLGELTASIWHNWENEVDFRKRWQKTRAATPYLFPLRRSTSASPNLRLRSCTVNLLAITGGGTSVNCTMDVFNHTGQAQCPRVRVVLFDVDGNQLGKGNVLDSLWTDFQPAEHKRVTDTIALKIPGTPEFVGFAGLN